MRLHAHAVDQVLFHQRFQNVADDVRLLVGRVLVVVIVEQLAACRCILLGELKRQRDIGLVAVDLDPCGLSVDLVVGTGVTNGAGIGSSFIHHVPCVEFHIGVIFFQRFHDGLDVVFQTLGHLVLGNPCPVGIEVFLEEPVRCLAVPYQHMTAYRNFVFAGEFQNLVCFVQRDLGHGVIAGFCHVLLGQCLIQHAVRLQFVAQCQAVVVLFDEVFGGTLCEFRTGTGTADLKVVGIGIFQRSNVVLNGRIRQVFADCIVHVEVHEILFLGGTGVAGLYIGIEVGRTLRHGEFAAHVFPFALVCSFGGNGVVVFLAVQVVLQVDGKFLGVGVLVAVIEHVGADFVVAAGFHDVRQTAGRTVPQLGSAGNIQAGRAAVGVLGGEFYLGTAAAVPLLGGVVVEVGFELVVQLDLCLFAFNDDVVNIIGLVGIGIRHLHIEDHIGGTGGNGVVALYLHPLSRSCLCGGNLIVVVCAVGIGVDHFDRHVLLTAALVHGTGRDLVALSGSHDSGQGAAGSTPVGGAVIAVQGSAAVVGLLRGQGQRGAYAFPCSVAAFERVVHQLLHLCGADQSRKGQTGDSKHTGGDCRHEFFEFHLISFLLSDFCGFCVSLHMLL